MKSQLHFLDLDPDCRDYRRSRYVVVPVPHEATTTYGRGTRQGPAAILRASQHIEEFDEELGFETCARAPVHTLKPVPVAGLQSSVAGLLMDSKVPVMLGGEHSITPVALKAFSEHFKDLSVLQLDAHADLRESFKGRKDSHASVMRRVLEICPAVQVGIRSISKEGWDFARQTGQIKKIHWAEKLELVEKIEDQLSRNVYITIDVDVFDPAVLPATGTPEPGGMFWYEVLDVLKAVCATKKVVGFDVVELAPRRGEIASDFTAARLVYKLMGYISAKETS